MSTLFCCLLYRNDECDREYARAAIGDALPAFFEEGLYWVPINKTISAILYHAGASTYKSTNFYLGVEYFLLEEFIDTVEQKARESGRDEFAFYGLLYSNMSPFEVAVKVRHDGFHGRLLIDGEGERIDVEGEDVVFYEQGHAQVDPEEFGADGEDDTHFDEDAYFLAQEEADAAFSGSLFIREELGLSIAQIVDAFANVKSIGEQLWPSPEILLKRDDMEFSDDPEPVVPAPPLWEWMTQR